MSLVGRGRMETTGNVGGYEKVKGAAAGERKGCGKEAKG